MNVDHVETSGGVDGDDGKKLLADGRTGAVADRGNGPEMYVTGNGVEKAKLLDKEEIHAEGHALVCGKKVRWQGDAIKTGGASCGGGPSGLAFKSGDFGTIDRGGADGIGDGERTVKDKIGGKQ